MLCTVLYEGENTSRYRTGVTSELLFKILQLSLPGQVSGSRVRPHFPICNLGFVVEVKHICEGLIPALSGFDPRKTGTPLNIDFTGLHIDHIIKVSRVFVGQAFGDNVEILGWVCECAAEEWRECG